jgi:hypothetical protein
LRDNENHRDFRGRGSLINVLRIFHIAGLAGISTVVLAGAGGALQWGLLMATSGLSIVALDAWANPDYFRQAKGLGTLFKIALVLLLVIWEAGRVPLFWFVLVFSVALSHAPSRVRHRKLF